MPVPFSIALTVVPISEGFESFLATKFPSAKRFGLEGGETLIPGMKAMIDTLVDQGASNVVMGMAHRCVLLPRLRWCDGCGCGGGDFGA
jgi:2-oxoglutarate dehydrogenase complex dehydrogenase (E1) component-like enzyme